MEVMGTDQCLGYAQLFNDFENNLFGSDFWCSYDTVRPWVDSGDIFYSAITHGPGMTLESIKSVASLIVVDSLSRDRIVSGMIHEDKILTFSASHPEAVPVLYFSSLILDEPKHILPLFRALIRDVDVYCAKRAVEIGSAFTIAIGENATIHAIKSGFIETSGPKYLDKYPILTLDAAGAKVHLWQRLLARRKS